MNPFFEYNWQVRDEWFEWCEEISIEELVKQRKGGVGSILETLFHIIDVEYSWIRGIQGKEDVVVQFATYNTLEKIKILSDTFRDEVEEFLKTGLDEFDGRTVSVPWDEETYTADEILHHIIIHEIHHIGQLSVWARELGRSPVSSNFIGREIAF
ncbi:DinB family protein [Ferdinandcohnia sp. Marseille-Q9671]